MEKLADEKDVVLIGPEAIAGMIFENFDDIDEKYLAKLGLVKIIKPL